MIVFQERKAHSCLGGSLVGKMLNDMECGRQQKPKIRSLWQESQVLSGEDNSRSLEDRGLGRVLSFLFGDVQEKPVTPHSSGVLALFCLLPEQGFKAVLGNSR